MFNIEIVARKRCKGNFFCTVKSKESDQSWELPESQVPEELVRQFLSRQRQIYRARRKSRPQQSQQSQQSPISQQSQLLHEQPARENNITDCRVCISNLADVHLIPCCHAICHTCASQYDICPICDTALTQKLIIIFQDDTTNL